MLSKTWYELTLVVGYHIHGRFWQGKCEYKNVKKLGSNLDSKNWKSHFNTCFQSGNWAYFLAK